MTILLTCTKKEDTEDLQEYYAICCKCDVRNTNHSDYQVTISGPQHMDKNESVATNTIYAQTPIIDMGGQTMAQIYVGCKSLVIDIYSMSTEKEFVNTLMDNIKQ